MGKFGNDFKKFMKKMPKRILEDEHDYVCPNCGEKFTIKVGMNICPRCKQEINLELR